MIKNCPVAFTPHFANLFYILFGLHKSEQYEKIYKKKHSIVTY